MKVEIANPDEVVRAEMESLIVGLLEDPWSMYHDMSKTAEMIDAALKVHDFYSLEEDHKKFLDQLDYSNMSQTC